jgi:hypothetical protein
MMYQLLLTMLAISYADACYAVPYQKPNQLVCAEKGHPDYKDSDLQNVVEKLVADIDREVGNGCLMNRKFIENSGNVWGDVESIGACKSSQDLKGILFGVRDYFYNRQNECRNVRIVSGDTKVASRFRLA